LRVGGRPVGKENMVAICFYTPDSYEELKKVADDRKALCDTYAEWLVELQRQLVD